MPQQIAGDLGGATLMDGGVAGEQDALTENLVLRREGDPGFDGGGTHCLWERRKRRHRECKIRRIQRTSGPGQLASLCLGPLTARPASRRPRRL